MYVRVYVSPAFRFSGRHHTDSITPSFFSNPRLGSSDRQPREGILRWSRQPNHHVAAPHSRSNTRWDPQVGLHPANGAAQPAVSTCTYLCLFPHCHSGFLSSPVHRFGSLRIYLSSLSESSVHIPVPAADVCQPAGVPAVRVRCPKSCPHGKHCWVKDVAKHFKQQEAFGKLFFKWLPEEKGVLFQKMESLLLFTVRVVLMGQHLVLRCRGFWADCYWNSVAISVWHFCSRPVERSVSFSRAEPCSNRTVHISRYRRVCSLLHWAL